MTRYIFLIFFSPHGRTYINWHEWSHFGVISEFLDILEMRKWRATREQNGPNMRIAVKSSKKKLREWPYKNADFCICTLERIVRIQKGLQFVSMVNILLCGLYLWSILALLTTTY